MTNLAIESALLNIMSKRQNYEEYIQYVDMKGVFKDTALILKDYGEYYKLYPNHSSIDLGLFATHFFQEWHTKLDDTEKNYYKESVFKAVAVECSDNKKVVSGLLKKQMQRELENSKSVDNAQHIFSEYEQKINSLYGDELHTQMYWVGDIDFSPLDKSGGIPHCIKNLQEALGGMVRGEFVLVTADNNVGKSAMCVAQAATAIYDNNKYKIKNPVLYFTSEDTPPTVFLRIVSHLMQENFEDLAKVTAESGVSPSHDFEAAYGKKALAIIDMSGITNVAQIEKKIRELNPSLVVIDIIDTLAPDEDTQNLKKLYDNLRRLANTYCPIYGSTQSGQTEYYSKKVGRFVAKRYLTLKDLYGSKSGKGGAATVVIGIGKDLDNQLMRYISVAKNKRGKPTSFACELNTQTNTFKPLAW
jgi:KaiC/GvpD/RAD55 family RecA-like ATPase